ncbi:hypothetical protein ANAEL_02417 [Anaerolineales bacterium]|nr:hypothetical protein ANAEL_02417 [Anaerolineales bacterium]
MRADRLLSLLLLLQSRGRMTAQELADTLEVSPRTIYRDVEALTLAGVPIYAEYRRGGGYALLENYRTTLTGMTDEEVRALFMLNIPAPLDALGLSEPLRRALLKLSAAVPSAHRQSEERVRQRIYLDSNWWFQGGESIPYLQLIQQAVWEDHQIFLGYILPMAGGVEIDQIVDPYGIVAKAGVWYLVYHYKGSLRAKRIAQLTRVEVLPTTFSRPADFELEAFWRRWCASIEHSRPRYPVLVRVSPYFLNELPRHLEDHIETAHLHPTATDSDGWIRLTLIFESLEQARQRILSFGRGVEVLEPEPLRLIVIDFATQIVSLYGTLAQA